MSTSTRLSFTTLAAVCLLAALASAQCPNNDVNCSFCMGSQCVACNGAVLSNGVCSVPVNDVSGCTAYGAAGTVYSNGTTSNNLTNSNGNNNGASTTDSNGNAYNSTTGVCTQCVSGFYVVNNTCLPNPVSNCASYTWTGGCTACFANIRALKDQCNGNTYGNSTLGTNLTCGAKHCEICGSNGACQGCGRGYILETSNNTCTTYRAGYYGCLRVSSGVCTACRYGFYYRNGGCSGSELINTGNQRINNNTSLIGPNKPSSLTNNNNNSSAARGLVGLAFVVLAALF